MVDHLSSGMIGSNLHLLSTRIQCGYLQIWSTRLGAAANWRGQGAEYGEEGTYDHEGWRVCHYDTTARGGQSAEINGERIAGHDINSDREGFAYCSVCPLLASFSSASHTP